MTADAHSTSVRADKAERARQRAAVKREKARLLRALADCEDRSAAIDERLATQHEDSAND
jgi:hypothetical protein